jgi:hypothetical protein
VANHERVVIMRIPLGCAGCDGDLFDHITERKVVEACHSLGVMLGNLCLRTSLLFQKYDESCLNNGVLRYKLF